MNFTNFNEELIMDWNRIIEQLPELSGINLEQLEPLDKNN